MAGLGAILAVTVVSTTLSTAAMPAQSPITRAVAAATREIAAAGPPISCRTPADDGDTVCFQPGTDSEWHFAALTIAVRPARGPLRSGSVLVDDTSMGPGGASTRFRGQTRDRQFDVLATQSESLGAKDRSLLPPAPQVIRRIVALYGRGR